MLQKGRLQKSKLFSHYQESLVNKIYQSAHTYGLLR